MNNTKCLHSNHGLKVYGKTTYGDATCPKCLLSAYTPIHTNISKNVSNSNDNTDFRNRSKCHTPLTDTVRSHFLSPGGEAELRCYKPHTPILNYEDIRPSEVPHFINKLEKLPKKLLHDTEKPWEEENSTSDEENIVIDEEKPSSYLDKSITEEKLKDISYGKRLLEDKERLERQTTKQFYKSSTQKFYEGADWKNILRPSLKSPLLPLQQHDTSNLNGQTKRYNDRSQDHQKLTEMSNWDFIQLRDGYFVTKPIAYVSESKKTGQIPRYSGCTSGYGEKDMEREAFTPLTIMRTDQPKFSQTGRKPFIPGYTGCVLSNQYKEAFTREPLARAETTARTHFRFNTYPQNTSKYRHISMVFH